MYKPLVSDNVNINPRAYLSEDHYVTSTLSKLSTWQSDKHPSLQQ